MKIIQDYPPNIDKIREKFDLKGDVVFTYGDACYSPSGGDFPKHLIAHEETHMRQQAAIGGPEIWWEKYLEDTEFRLQEEIEAYGVQLKTIRKQGGGFWRTALAKLAEDLAGPIYGYSISYAAAYQKILLESTRI